MKNSIWKNYMKILDFKIIVQDLNRENKYKKKKEVFLRELFENSIKIIKHYIQKLDKNYISSSDSLNIIYKKILDELNEQRLKQIEDINLLSIVLNSNKEKLFEINNEYLNNSLIEEKHFLENEKFILFNQIREKDSMINIFKKCLKKLKDFDFLKEQRREIFLNNPIDLKKLIIFHHRNHPNEKKIIEEITNKKDSKRNSISKAIFILNKNIKLKKKNQYKQKAYKGFIFKLFNERKKVIYKVNVNNIDSDISNCSSLDSTFNYEDYFINNHINSNSEYLLSKEYNKILFSENEYNGQNSLYLNEFSNIKYKYLKIKKENSLYKKQILKLKNLIKRMNLQINQLNSMVKLSTKK